MEVVAEKKEKNEKENYRELVRKHLTENPFVSYEKWLEKIQEKKEEGKG